MSEEKEEKKYYGFVAVSSETLFEVGKEVPLEKHAKLHILHRDARKCAFYSAYLYPSRSILYCEGTGITKEMNTLLVCKTVVAKGVVAKDLIGNKGCVERSDSPCKVKKCKFCAATKAAMKV